VRLATITTSTGPRLHVRGRSGHIDLAETTGDLRFAALGTFLAAGPQAMEAARELTGGTGMQYAPVLFGPAVPAPERILCFGVNYSDHAIESRGEVPTWPEVFVRGHGSVLGPYEDLVRPALTDGFDYEGELGVVIGAGGRYIPASKALDAVAGFVVLNDASARDWQRANTQWTPGKNFDGSMPIGPEVVTTDEADVSDVLLTTTLNGEVMQSARTSQMIVDIASGIEYLSSFTTLRPGDVIATGTPGGVGFARKPPVWLTPGDVVEVTVEGVGSIRNRVVAEEGAPRDWRWHPGQR
jgi:2-keto-4-pentenoate hydratase/2-oxohepta-3-ene-1,7-dioic acid hydratase in catechol pathway